jgi:hypothetical protein
VGRNEVSGTRNEVRRGVWRCGSVEVLVRNVVQGTYKRGSEEEFGSMGVWKSDRVKVATGCAFSYIAAN